jgi:GWxTD domain-containing protein
MKNLILYCIFICLLVYTSTGFSQLSFNPHNPLHNKGLTELQNGNRKEAETFFKLSAAKYSYAPSLYQLAKINYDYNTIKSRSRARDYIQKAIWKDERNIEYRLLQAELMEKFSGKIAYNYYEDILEIDSKCSVAWYNLGRIKEGEFYEFNNSMMKTGNDPSLSLDQFAMEDFIKAEGQFNRAIRYDSTYIDAYLHLSYLYEEIGEPERGIPLLKKVIELEPDKKEGYLYLGLLCYKALELEECYSAYQQALRLMSNEEKNDFKFNSAELFISAKLNDDLFEQEDLIDEKVVNDYWDEVDPLYLTAYNERLLEHYSRVAYSNLRFSISDLDVTGWNSDRGEILVRYGEPIQKIRYRPYISAGGRTALMLKTDLWIYKDKILGFVDEYWTGNFRYSTPRPGSRHHSQFVGDTDFFVKELMRSKPESYDPKFMAPIIYVPFNIAQFKNIDDEKSKETQLYLNYAMESSDQLNTEELYPLAHKYGLFFTGDSSVDRTNKINSVKEFNRGNKIKCGLYEEYFINSILLETKPDTGQLAFELIRNDNRGVATNHFQYRIKEYNESELAISDIILALDVNKTNNKVAAIQRGSYNILPNPMQTFTNSTDVFLYYEVYNLILNERNQANFKQRISIRKTNEESTIGDLFNSVIGIFGFGIDEDELTLTTDYQSYKKNNQIYLQIDMNNYAKGDYFITVSVEDEVSGNKVNEEILIRWR